jgi:hypothetical protein
MSATCTVNVIFRGHITLYTAVMIMMHLLNIQNLLTSYEGKINLNVLKLKCKSEYGFIKHHNSTKYCELSKVHISSSSSSSSSSSTITSSFP